MNEQLALAEEQTHSFNNVFSFSLCCTLYMETKPETFRALQTDRQTDRQTERGHFRANSLSYWTQYDRRGIGQVGLITQSRRRA